MHALLQTVGSAEVQSGWSGLMLIGTGIVGSILAALGLYATNYFRGKGELVKKDLEIKGKELDLKSKEQELAQLEIEEKIGAVRRRIALDAATIAEEQGRDRKLSGSAKAVIAAAKVEELLSESAAPNVEGSKLNDLVKLGVAQLRQSGATTFLITPSMAPPPEQPFAAPNKLPAPAGLPTAPATKTLPERPGAKR